MNEGDQVRVILTGEIGQVVEITRWGGRTEYMVELGEDEIGFDRSELEVVA